MVGVPLWFWATVAFIVGTCIGSFLNVVVYRLPIATKELNLNNPKWSFCPNCKRRLTAFDLVPLFSFLLLGQKCRGCKLPISWRYFSVELLTGLLFLAITIFFRTNAANAVAFCAFAAVMVPVFCIDWVRFEIPDTLNILATLIPLVRDIYGISMHEPGFDLMWGWLPRSVFGALVGMAIFGGVRIVGWLWKGVEAMGLGDVLLARGMGAMLTFLVPVGSSPARLHLVWLLGACVSGIVIGVPLIKSRERRLQSKMGEIAPPSVSSAEEPPFEREGTFGSQVYEVAWCFWFGDLWNYLNLTFLKPELKVELAEAEDDWEVPETAIPFGPFMIVGFFLTLFCGEMLVASYLRYAIPPRETAVTRIAVPGTSAQIASSKTPKHDKTISSRFGKG